MKKGILLSLAAALVVFGAACGQTSNNTPANHEGMNHGGMNHNAMDHSAMNHNSMPMNANQMSSMAMNSDPNAASAPFDLQFIDTMSVHHDDAVKMAEMALKNSQNEELKKFAQKIIDDQKREIAQMKEWREKWYAGKPGAKNMEMPGMMDSMKHPMDADSMKKMEALKGKEFDLHFLDMMIPHHEGAVKMSKAAEGKFEHPELKTLAGQIIKAQEAEIKMMSDWKAQWSK